MLSSETIKGGGHLRYPPITLEALRQKRSSSTSAVECIARNLLPAPQQELRRRFLCLTQDTQHDGVMSASSDLPENLLHQAIGQDV